MSWQGSSQAFMLLCLLSGVANGQTMYDQNAYDQNTYGQNAYGPAPQYQQQRSDYGQAQPYHQTPHHQAATQYGASRPNAGYQGAQTSTNQRYPMSAEPSNFRMPAFNPAWPDPSVNQTQMNRPASYPVTNYDETRVEDPQRTNQFTHGFDGQTPIGNGNSVPSRDQSIYRTPTSFNTPARPAPTGIGSHYRENVERQDSLPLPPAAGVPARDYSQDDYGTDYLPDSHENIYADGAVDFAYGDQASCGQGCCGPCVCPPSGFLFGAETLFFKYGRSDGTRYGTSGSQEIVEFNPSIAPRLTFGYLPSICCGWPGIRLRWFDYEDHAPGSTGTQGLGVDTYVIDVEFFRPYVVNPEWSLEFSGGVRFTSFREIMSDGSAPELRINDIDAFGGVFGVQTNHRLWCGSVYGRARLAVLSGDKYHRNDNTPVTLSLNDTIVGMTEIGIGYELQHTFMRRDGCRSWTGFGRIGAEWQHWHNFSTEFVNIAPGGEDSGGPSDVGFIGLTFEIGVYF